MPHLACQHERRSSILTPPLIHYLLQLEDISWLSICAHETEDELEELMIGTLVGRYDRGVEKGKPTLDFF